VNSNLLLPSLLDNVVRPLVTSKFNVRLTLKINTQEFLSISSFHYASGPMHDGQARNPPILAEETKSSAQTYGRMGRACDPCRRKKSLCCSELYNGALIAFMEQEDVWARVCLTMAFLTRSCSGNGVQNDLERCSNCRTSAVCTFNKPAPVSHRRIYEK
jgi:hypothetical protein